MDQTLFSGTAWVEFQGARVMALIQITSRYAKYKVSGFKHPITIQDYRKHNLPLIRQAHHTGDASDFISQFNAPAHVSIQRQEASKLVVKLHDSDDPDPAYRLWAAVGIDNHIPVYDYVFERLARLGGDEFAFFALYRRREGEAGSEVASSVS